MLSSPEPRNHESIDNKNSQEINFDISGQSWRINLNIRPPRKSTGVVNNDSYIYIAKSIKVVLQLLQIFEIWKICNDRFNSDLFVDFW